MRESLAVFKMKKIFQEKARILSKVNLGKEYFRLSLAAENIARCACPGQFLEVRVQDSQEPLLRRPLGIHCVRGSQVEVLYEVLGKGTQILSQKKAGEYLNVLGPLGNGFSYRTQGHKVTRTQVLVAGGMGVAPLLFLAERLVTRTQGHKDTSKPTILLGAKTKSQILCEKEFIALGCEVKIATDDGSKGFKGYVSDLLKNLLKAYAHERAPAYPIRPGASLKLAATIYACGPKPMLKEIALISAKYHIPAQVSLEEHMACGIGACLGCVVSTKNGYKRVCKEGPVFNADEIIWE
jgi:dihydroorotate dehydrogenase electron transfer subunit